jgi:hypothetical protein
MRGFIFSPFLSPTVSARRPGPGASALQQGDVLLASHRAGVMRVDHFYAGACIAREGQQVNALAVQQPESNR